MDTLEKLEYKVKAGIPEAIAEKKRRLKDKILLPLPGINAENIYITDLSILKQKIADLRTLYQNVPEHYRVASVILLDAHSSAAIEGAHTTVARMEQCLNSPESKSEIMVANTYKGCMFAYEYPITQDNIRELWEIITENVCENSDKAGTLYRDGMVSVGNLEGTVHTTAPVDKIPEFMTILFDFMQSSELDIILKSFIFHFYFVYVHPFCDGNGRTARTINNSQLSWGGLEKIKSVAIANAINRKLPEYYRAIRDCEKVQKGKKKEKWLDLSPFISYMMDILEQGMVNAMLADNALNETEKLILDRMNRNGINAEITVKKAAQITKLTEDYTRRILNDLANKGYLVVDKNKKTYIYKLMPHYE